jgi:hypothetical protein
MGGPLALDGRRLMGGHNNQPKVVVDGEGGVGEETRPGLGPGRRRPPIENFTHNNQPKTGSRNRGDNEGEARQAGGAGEARYHRFREALQLNGG